MKTKEKAKAYDEAVEQAKKELNTCGSLDCDAARQIFRLFPELRESKKPLTPFQQCLNYILLKVYFASISNTEDVNKFIVNIVKNHTDELVELAKKHKYTDYQLAKSEDEIIRNDIMVAVKNWFPYERVEEIRAYLEKQKEQKPAKYLDKDMVYAIMKKLLKLAAFSQLIPINSEEYKMIDEITCDVRKLLDYPTEQKPAEWSEEDEKLLNYAISMTDDAQVKRFLKSLRPSWKPSEDEERLINTSISFLKDFADKGYENAVECIDWLKSKLNGNSGK